MADNQDNDRNKKPVDSNPKQRQLDRDRVRNTGPGKKLTDDHGVRVSNAETTLRAGNRGPTLLQDFHFYKKLTAFNRERIPEKVVHARGFAVHGEFVAYKSMRHVTRAHFLQERSEENTSELQSRGHLVCRHLREKKNT